MVSDKTATANFTQWSQTRQPTAPAGLSISSPRCQNRRRLLWPSWQSDGSFQSAADCRISCLKLKQVFTAVRDPTTYEKRTIRLAPADLRAGVRELSSRLS